MKKVQLTSDGIKKHLASTTPVQSCAEYIWNALDARAKNVEISFVANEIGGIERIKISDDGVGIPHELLDSKFGVFLDSEKKSRRKSTKRVLSEIHGKDGIGRLTFYSFSQRAEWETVYEADGRKYRYIISVDSSNLVNYPANNPEEIDAAARTGTSVTFYNVDSSVIDVTNREFRSFLVGEFCWKLLLQDDVTIVLDGVPLTAQENISEDTFLCPLVDIDPPLTIRMVRWTNKLHREFSRYYFSDSKGSERFTDFTALNKKGDAFYHSVYVSSTFFDNFVFESEYDNQATLLDSEYSPKNEWFKIAKKSADDILRGARKDFLRISKDKIINDFVERKILPPYNERNKWEVIRHTQLTDTVGELYNIQPNLFTSGSVDQKKILIRLIDQLLDSSEAESLYKIIGQVLDLEQTEKEALLDILKVSRLSSVVKTVKLIQDRYRALEQVKRLNWDAELNAMEVPHIQEFMELHFWMIGEEFSLVVAAEKDFEQALRELYAKISTPLTDGKLDHADKNKEMDIFVVRQDKYHNKIHNVVLELKHPNKRLGKKYVRQVETYFEVVFSDARFNASNMEWSYYLIGNEYDNTGFIDAQLENAKNHGESSLIFKAKNHKIYVKRWSELITDVELRHNFLNEKLQIQREQLVLEEGAAKTADEVISRAQSLSCVTKG
ncbi:ATP-binding protein [Paraburkholderia sp. MM6662-R1]|uniref:ATP-binding protein n=1 Tax=Paraburkholderia sp. MM6662-R1 TaxID=2991066 RepID=UPI003D1B6071